MPATRPTHSASGVCLFSDFVFLILHTHPKTVWGYIISFTQYPLPLTGGATAFRPVGSGSSTRQHKAGPQDDRPRLRARHDNGALRAQILSRTRLLGHSPLMFTIGRIELTFPHSSFFFFLAPMAILTKQICSSTSVPERTGFALLVFPFHSRPPSLPGSTRRARAEYPSIHQTPKAQKGGRCVFSILTIVSDPTSSTAPP